MDREYLRINKLLKDLFIWIFYSLWIKSAKLVSYIEGFSLRILTITYNGEYSLNII